MSVPIRARLHVSAHQGQVSVPIRVRLYVSAQQGQVIGKCPAGPGYRSVPSRANNVAGVVCLRVTASIAVVNAPQ